MMTSRRHIGYSRLAAEDCDDDDSELLEEEDLRFTYTPKALEKVPWKSIVLALFLLFMGSALLLVFFFVFMGHMDGDDSHLGLLILGILAFLPGFYETRVAYYSWRGVPGYRFTSIPAY